MEPTDTTPPPIPPPVPPASIPAASKPVPATRNWWQRNWKWFVPTGCLTFIALGLAFVGCIALLVFGAMKSSDAYRIALARAKADPRVTEALGTPIEEGLFVSGNTSVSGALGKSNLAIPIHGPKGTATIYAVALKAEGKWEYAKLLVQIEKTGQSIDLSEQPNE